MTKETILRYATQHGAGWRADYLGDMIGFSKNWYFMRDSYPVSIKESGIQDVWKTAPIAWETCWDMRFVSDSFLMIQANLIRRIKEPMAMASPTTS
jgi:hypothetical protein